MIGHLKPDCNADNLYHCLSLIRGTTGAGGWTSWPLENQMDPLIRDLILLAAMLGGWYANRIRHPERSRNEGSETVEPPAPRV